MEWGAELISVTGVEGSEMVVTCLAGRNMRAYLGQLYRLAQCNGCRSIRYHSDRPGIAKIVAAYGFNQSGEDDTGRTVYRCRVQ